MLSLGKWLCCMLSSYIYIYDGVSFCELCETAFLSRNIFPIYVLCASGRSSLKAESPQINKQVSIPEG